MKPRRVTRNGRMRSLVATLAVCALSLVLVSTSVPTAALADAAAEGYWIDNYGFRQAWQTTKGDGITVAIIDTGVANVPDLVGAVVGGADFSGVGSSDGRTPVGGEDKIHGTLVGSLIAGAGGSVQGVAPDVSLLAISVGLGEDAPYNDEQISDAVRWAVDNGADIINMSLTRNSLSWPKAWDDAFLYAEEQGVIVVAAAGNRGSGTVEVGAPATIPGVVTVGGVDSEGVASFNASSQGITIAVTAPSENLLGITPDNVLVNWDGTSGAAPLVSGLLALIWAAHPTLDAPNVINQLISTAVPVGNPVPGPLYGYGHIDAAAAVSREPVVVTKNPLGSIAEWIAVYRPSKNAEALGPSPVAPPARLGEAEGTQKRETTGPSIAKLVANGLPIGVISVFLASFGAIIAMAVLNFRRLTRKKEPVHNQLPT